MTDGRPPLPFAFQTRRGAEWAPMRTAPAVLLAAALAALSGGCASSKPRPAVKEGIRQPTVTFRAVAVETLDLTGTRLGFEFLLENANPFPVAVAGVDWRFEVDGAVIAQDRLPGGAVVPASASLPIRFPVQIEFAALPDSAVRMAVAGGGAHYRLSGTAALSRAADAAGSVVPASLPAPAPEQAPVVLPFAYEDKLEMPRPPDIAVEGIGIDGSALTQLSLSLRIRVENPNPFPLPSGNVSFGVTLAGSSVVNADARTLGALPARGKTVLVVPVALSLGRAGHAFVQITRGRPVEAAVHGEVNLGGFVAPIGFVGTVSATR